VKEEKKLINKSFKVFNANRTKNGEVIDKLKDVKYFNKLNLIWEYNNVQIKKVMNGK